MKEPDDELTRRRFFQVGAAAVVHMKTASMVPTPSPANAQLQEAIARLEYLTPLDRAFILDKGKADVARLTAAQLRDIGLAPETWSLDVLPDPASNSIVKRPLTRERGTALTWDQLMAMARTQAARFLHVTACTNGTNPFHMTLWEGVPLRDVLRLAEPQENVRRVYYQSYHREGVAPFQSSLALGQVLESPPGEVPPVLAFRMNGQFLPASHGGPVRMVVPGAYGSKSIKWLQRLVLTNEFKANDSDADLNNDPENGLKTRARFINEPTEVAADTPVPLTGFAQIGISGLSRVQYAVRAVTGEWPADDPYRSRADWRDAEILPPPANWGGGLPDGKLPATSQTDPTGVPLRWPLRYTLAHWAAMLPGLSAGRYELCCRTIDGNGLAQPLPRTLPRTGFNTLHVVALTVKP
jgi:DMSO/TMAO reductase YedYZ molybdopterin-dependent catalytic subunit